MSVREKIDDRMDEAKLHYQETLEELVATFVPAIDTASTIESQIETATADRRRRRTKLFISGISGSGKSTVTRVLEDAGFSKLRNITTRPARPDESDKDYIFTDDETFDRWRLENLIFHPHITNKVRHGILLEDLGRFKGAEKLFADKSVGSTIVIAQEIPEIVEQTNFVYLLPPSFDVLRERIMKREERHENGMGVDEVAERFEEEIEDLARTAMLPYIYIVNDDRERVEAIIRSLMQE